MKEEFICLKNVFLMYITQTFCALLLADQKYKFHHKIIDIHTEIYIKI